MVPVVQGKLPWRPTTPTAVWASPSMPGLEVRKTVQPYETVGGGSLWVSCISQEYDRGSIFRNTCYDPTI